MATLKAKETLYLPAGAKARLPKNGRLVARAKLKRNKPRVNQGKLSSNGVNLSTSVEYPVK